MMTRRQAIYICDHLQLDRCKVRWDYVKEGENHAYSANLLYVVIHIYSESLHINSIAYASETIDVTKFTPSRLVKLIRKLAIRAFTKYFDDSCTYVDTYKSSGRAAVARGINKALRGHKIQ